ncbi:hypothetical protein ILUMI_20154 [Ignelater luminosus]|uniref:Regulatory protein zeste n=1 Tax=Ignelater luminosus TaxID=2038154 RepID=A0A8K0G4U1_IGNLU|nr:hypothetical protein ILUMI_20154 [Ignelater luminosus]
MKISSMGRVNNTTAETQDIESGDKELLYEGSIHELNQLDLHDDRYDYRQYHQPPPSHPHQQRGRGRGRKPPADKTRDKKRSDEFREKKGAETMKLIQKDIEDALFFGFEDMKEAISDTADLIPRPNKALSTSVLFSNLRSTVVALSDARISQQIRKDFYDTSPLPGAIWGGRRIEGMDSDDDDEDGTAHPRRRRRRPVAARGDWPLLLNPDDFMPVNYTIEDLRDDVNRFQDLVNWASRKNLKYTKKNTRIKPAGFTSSTRRGCIKHNMSEAKSRLRNISKQKTILSEYIEANSKLVSGRFSASFTFKDAQLKWEQLVATLNAIPGAQKDWKKWRKVI